MQLYNIHWVHIPSVHTCVHCVVCYRIVWHERLPENSKRRPFVQEMTANMLSRGGMRHAICNLRLQLSSLARDASKVYAWHIWGIERNWLTHRLPYSDMLSLNAYGLRYQFRSLGSTLKYIDPVHCDTGFGCADVCCYLLCMSYATLVDPHMGLRIWCRTKMSWAPCVPFTTCL